MLYVSNLSFFKYVFLKKLSSFVLKNIKLFSFLLTLIQNFNFFFIYKVSSIYLLTHLFFNTQRVLTTITLFLKKTNCIFLSQRALNRLMFLSPSCFFLCTNNFDRFGSYLKNIGSKKGGRLLSVFV